MIEAIEPEAELFALAEQVDLVEKAVHDALARRNEAQIAYFAQAKHHDARGTRSGKNSRGSRAGNSRHRGPTARQHSRHDGNRAQAEGVIRFARSPTASSKTSCNFKNGKP
jgi:hypothetical protein